VAVQGVFTGATLADAPKSGPSPAQASSSHPSGQAEGEGKGRRATAQWRVYTDMGREMVSRGRAAEAVPYLERAVEEAKAGFGERDAHYAAALHNLAELHRMRHEFTEARRLLEQAVTLLDELQHRSLGGALRALGTLKRQQSDLPGARDALQRACRATRDAVGDTHPEYAHALFALAGVEIEAGMAMDAVPLLRQSVDVLDAAGMGGTDRAVRHLNRLAGALLSAGCDEEAVPVLRRLLATAEQLSGDDHPNAAVTAAMLARTLSKSAPAEARELLGRAMAIWERREGSSGGNVGGVLAELGKLEAAQGQTIAARETLGRAVEIARDRHSRAMAAARPRDSAVHSAEHAELAQAERRSRAAASASALALATSARALAQVAQAPGEAAGLLREADLALVTANSLPGSTNSGPASATALLEERRKCLLALAAILREASGGAGSDREAAELESEAAALHSEK